jgi:hypothetical protein
MPSIAFVSPKRAPRRPALNKASHRPKKLLTFELTPADIALDNAISAAAARGLAARRK